VSIPRNNLLYLPVVKLNEGGGTGNTTRDSIRGAFIIAVDATAQTAFSNLDGALYGETPSTGVNYIRCDQGLDTSEISPSRAIDPLLSETMYQIDIDNRLGSIVSTTGTKASISFVDDDNIATYFLSLGTDAEFVEENTYTTTDTVQTISGPRGTLLKFMVQSSLELNTSDYYFTTIGTSAAIADNDGDTTYNIIKSTIRVIGVNTGYRLDIPVEFVKIP
jgi:hypothetical protein